VATLHELLQPQVILNVISRIKTPNQHLSRFLGFQVGGGNVRQIRGRYAQFRIFDHTRTIMMGRSPGSPPATVPPNPIGAVNVTIHRGYEKVPMDYEGLGNLSPLKGPNAQVDKMGEDYIMQQERYLAQRVNNLVELMTVGMLRGQFYWKMSGENLIPTLTSPATGVTISFNVPAGNQNQLNMTAGGNIIDGYWSNPNTNILLHLMKIKQAFYNLHGFPLKHVWLNSKTWNDVINNLQVRNIGGTAQTPFQSFDWVEDKGNDGDQLVEYKAVLRSDPSITWHITDSVIAPDGTDPSYSAGTATLKKVIDDDTAHFLPDPDPAWSQMVHGSEPLVEVIGQQPTEREGIYFYHRFTDQPGAIELVALANVVPVLYIPKTVTFATVSGF
jgi:hypothetical protein